MDGESVELVFAPVASKRIAGRSSEVVNGPCRGRCYGDGMRHEDSKVLYDVDEMDLGAELLRQGGCVTDGYLGVLTEIRGNQYATKSYHGYWRTSWWNCS